MLESKNVKSQYPFSIKLNKFASLHKDIGVVIVIQKGIRCKCELKRMNTFVAN